MNLFDTVQNVDQDGGRFDSCWSAGVISGIGRHGVCDEQVAFQTLLASFDGDLPELPVAGISRRIA